MISTMPMLISTTYLSQPCHYHCTSSFSFLRWSSIRSRNSPHSVTVDRHYVLCYLWFWWTVVLTSGMPRLLGIATVEFRTFTYH
ncbi:hypothetical protein BDR03DRAFT_73277 [Suillus americanus]|nr:hypothetical protein BDR03DRAFT_73277 [Suillus americanus]